MLEVKVTVTLAPEVLDILGQLINGKASVGNTKKEGKQTGKVLDYQQKPEDDKGEVDTGGVTLNDLKSLAKEIIKSDEKRETLKSILAEMGIKKVTDVEERDFVKMHKKLAALQGG